MHCVNLFHTHMDTIELDNVRNDCEMYCALRDYYVNYLLEEPTSELGSVNFVNIKATFSKTHMQFLFVFTVSSIRFQ